MLSYKHNEYEYIYDENNEDNLIEIRKDDVLVNNVQSPISNLEDAKALQNTVLMLGIEQ
ncbi:hypothetical protein ACN077_09125 [Clostridium chromiireducens]|uniref:Uncharacterized protein n=1 Tax=Clostridium chromiireducens TaxID=225345 RepID=A0A964RMI3_9CLOT|nr:hypothetical protein [Clostridium chromiireducens]MVX64307.1 hypothetical protein [Clostridium chromiireducens]